MADYSWLFALNNNKSETQNTIPDYLTNASQTGINYATNLLNSPVAKYNGTLAAGLTADQKAAGDMIRGSVGKFQPGYENAQSQINASTGNYQSVTPDTFKAGLSNINAYLNPYVSGVVDVASANGAKALANNLNTLRGNALSGGAGYGSRQGVQEGAAAAENALNQQNYIYNAMTGAFDRASGLLGQDIQNKLTADTTNAANNENYLNRLRSAGMATTDTTNAARTANVGDINNLLTYGSLDQSTQDKIYQAKYNEWLRQQNVPLQRLAAFNSTVQGAPHSTTTSTNSTGWSMNPQQNATSNPWMTGAGLAGTAASLFAAPANGTSAASGLFNAAKTGIGLLGLA